MTTAHDFPALGFDPAPGDVDLTRGLARQLGSIATELGTTVQEIDQIECGAWKGKAAKAFADHVAHDVEPLLRKAHESFEHSSHAMANWASRLDGFQQEARALEREAAAKKSALSSAQAAAGVSVDGHRPVPSPSPETAPQPSAAQAAAAAADAKRKQHALSDADSALNGVISRAHELQDRYNSAAKAIGGQLHKAGDIAPDKPGFFSRMVHDVEGAWTDCAQWLHDHADMIAHIGDILSAISSVLGVLAIITAPLEPLGAIFAASAMAFSGAALLTQGLAKLEGADVSWADLAFDAVGLIPGIKGATSGVKLAEGADVAARAGQLGDDVRGVTGISKQFKLFGPLKAFPVLRANNAAGRATLAMEGAYQNVRGGQLLGSKGVNMLTKLPFIKSTELIAPMSGLGRGIDATVKGAMTARKIHGIAKNDFGLGASPVPAH
ncbi:enoyl-CoA hydratase/isomerase family protein [Streptomyces sp. SL13]|uniref:Enoyl-CoA hydratase/isomerase family protein n=1 Tax=Streptantibioticus silvisoli TaxID=2705255 RepID=A0AA90GZU3_9ACTN|nr:enoyl-CoA hydratase/isomerase family protein [Streptantibioticus silvisoli]MDI5964254.1 enoyl-CoA hydratase/isomerase family protein [Streptantibioticus silvisoli]MDI5970644.1 enoyl-CoA hydratase/isomerase family protein [Streptantibioticus silvisoli]